MTQKCMRQDHGMEAMRHKLAFLLCITSILCMVWPRLNLSLCRLPVQDNAQIEHISMSYGYVILRKVDIALLQA